jgi:hypothetical protein
MGHTRKENTTWLNGGGGGDGISKDDWGAGFTDTRVMNRYLLANWPVKIERGDDTLCVTC